MEHGLSVAVTAPVGARRQSHSYPQKPFQCSKCPYITNKKWNLGHHLNTHQGLKPFPCNVCNTHFTQAAHLKVHLIKKHLEIYNKEYKCTKCEYGTYCKDRLTTHINNNHTANDDGKKHRCPHCPFRSKRKKNYKAHLLRHEEIKPFMCKICKKQFVQKLHLENHLKTKHIEGGNKQYKCTKCPFETYYKGGLKKHLALHDNPKLFTCSICSRQYGFKENLMRHIRGKHKPTQITRLKCSKCPYETHCEEYLDAHMYLHEQYQCEVCGNKYKTKETLYKHKKKKHVPRTGEEASNKNVRYAHSKFTA